MVDVCRCVKDRERCHVMRDMIQSWPLWLVGVCMIVVHTSLTFLLPVPHCPRSLLLLSLPRPIVYREFCVKLGIFSKTHDETARFLHA